MLVSESSRLVFFAIPKTGTRSIYKLMSSEPFNGINIGDHKHILPSEYEDFTKFTIIRNPYDRMFSLYWSCCQKAGDMKGFVALMRQEGFDNTFEDFMKWLVKHKEEFHYINQSNFLMLKSQLAFFENKLDYVLRFESLDKMLSSLPVFSDIPSLPHVNKSNYNDESKVKDLSSTVIALVNDYCNEEFDFLGYKKIKA